MMLGNVKQESGFIRKDFKNPKPSIVQDFKIAA